METKVCLEARKKIIYKNPKHLKMGRLSAIMYMSGHKISNSHMLVKYVSG